MGPLLVAALLGAGCDDDSAHEVDCGSGEYINTSRGRFCAYLQGASGIECPSELPYRIPVGGALVCSEGYISPADLPADVCALLEDACDAASRDSGTTDGGAQRDAGTDGSAHNDGSPSVDGAVDAAADGATSDAGHDAGQIDAGVVVDCAEYDPPSCNGTSCNVTCAETGQVPCAAGCCNNGGITYASVGELTYDLPEYQVRIAVSDDGTPHVVYEEAGEIWYWNPSFGTNGVQYVGPEPEVEPADFYLKPIIELDPEGAPFILAIQDFSPDGNAGYLLGGTWRIGPVPRAFGLQFDHWGMQHITTLTNDEVQYRVWDGASSWDLQPIPAKGVRPGIDRFAEYDGDFALDSMDRAHIVVAGTSANNFRYIHWTGSAWDTEIVEVGSRAFRPQIALDQNDTPHVVFDGADGVTYGRRDTSDWIFTVVDADTSSRAPYTFDVDACGRPHIAYQVYEDREDYFRWFRYAVWTGTQWARLDLNPGSPYNQNGDIDIRVSANANAHVVWQDFDHVLYRRIPTGPW